MTPLIQQAVRLAPEPETAMWFDVGLMKPIGDTRVPADILMHLPFKRTGVAGIDTQGRPFSLWMVQGENSITVSGCKLDAGTFFQPVAYILTPEGLRYYNNDKEVSREEIMPVFRMVASVLVKLHDGATGYRAIAKRGLINDKRRRKGKKPLFDWHTVTIEPPAPKADPQGGHHASPRKHDRRGHWRTYRSGKRGWVQNCVVGNAALGVVFKDYEVRT